VNVLLEQVRKFRHLLLHSRELVLQGAQRLWQSEQRGGQGRPRGGHRGRWHCWQQRQSALMETRQLTQVVLTEAMFAAIARMGLQVEVGVGEPAMQGFGIDAQVPTGVGDREEDHRDTPLRVVRQKPEQQAGQLQG
jgi:hypothetical protein